jgi:hypothetical protein
MIQDVTFEPLGSVTNPPNQLSNAFLNISKIAADIVKMYSKVSETSIQGNYGVVIHKGIRQMYQEIQNMYYQMGGAGPVIPDEGGSLHGFNYVPPSTAFYYLLTGRPIDMLYTDLVLDAHTMFFGIDLNLYA